MLSLALGPGRARGWEALPSLPPPFSRRPAPPSGRGADGRAWGGVAAAAEAGAGAGRTLPGRRPAGVWGSAGPGLYPAPLGAATEGDNEMQGRLGRVRLGFSDPAPVTGGPGPREGKDYSPD